MSSFSYIYLVLLKLKPVFVKHNCKPTFKIKLVHTVLWNLIVIVSICVSYNFLGLWKHSRFYLTEHFVFLCSFSTVCKGNRTKLKQNKQHLFSDVHYDFKLETHATGATGYSHYLTEHSSTGEFISDTVPLPTAIQ